MESFFKAMEPIMIFSPQSRDALSRIMTRHVFSKGYHLLRETSVCSSFYFIEKGLTRTYYIKNNKDITDWFSSEGQFAVSILSYPLQKERNEISGLQHYAFCNGCMGGMVQAERVIDSYRAYSISFSRNSTPEMEALSSVKVYSST